MVAFSTSQPKKIRFVCLFIVVAAAPGVIFLFLFVVCVGSFFFSQFSHFYMFLKFVTVFFDEKVKVQFFTKKIIIVFFLGPRWSYGHLIGCGPGFKNETKAYCLVFTSIATANTTFTFMTANFKPVTW